MQSLPDTHAVQCHNVLQRRRGRVGDGRGLHQVGQAAVRAARLLVQLSAQEYSLRGEAEG